MERSYNPLPKTVKEFVDFIYEYLIEHPDGLTFSMKELIQTRTQKRIASILIQRGIIEKTAVSAVGRRGCQFKYKWIATMAPTKTLYGSIVSEIRNEMNNWPSWKNKKKKEDSKPIVPETKEPTPIQDAVEENQFILEYDLEHSYGFADKPGLYAFPDGNMTVYVLTDAAGHILAATHKGEYRQDIVDVTTVSKRYHGDIRCATEDETKEFIREIFEGGGLFKYMWMFFGLKDFSDQELWDELKRRGYNIEGNRLVIIKKAYLN